MVNLIKKMGITFIISILFITSALAAVFTNAPNNGFNILAESHERSQSLKSSFNNSAHATFDESNLKILQPEDFIDLEKLSPASLELAREDFIKGNIISVDSVVGNATRLGNPPGGKGVVEIAKNISFLEAKIIRLAVDSNFLGVNIPEVLWSSDENLKAATDALKNMEEKISNNEFLSKRLKEIVIKYLNGSNITIMAQSDLMPVIDEFGNLTSDRLRNLGAGELVPTIIRSGVAEKLGFNSETKVVFSNIDFDLNFLEVIAATYEAKNPDLMQVHVPTNASGGSAYWVNTDKGWKIIPLEGIEVPDSISSQISSLNSNTVVLQGNALKQQYYDELPIPFEKKLYEGQVFHLPKVSLSDIGKNENVKNAVAIGPVDKYFFTGSKNIDLLREQGDQEITKRIVTWTQRSKSSASAFINNVKAKQLKLKNSTCISMVSKFF